MTSEQANDVIRKLTELGWRSAHKFRMDNSPLSFRVAANDPRDGVRTEFADPLGETAICTGCFNDPCACLPDDCPCDPE